MRDGQGVEGSGQQGHRAWVHRSRLREQHQSGLRGRPQLLEQPNRDHAPKMTCGVKVARAVGRAARRGRRPAGGFRPDREGRGGGHRGVASDGGAEGPGGPPGGPPVHGGGVASGLRRALGRLGSRGGHHVHRAARPGSGRRVGPGRRPAAVGAHDLLFVLRAGLPPSDPPSAGELHGVPARRGGRAHRRGDWPGSRSSSPSGCRSRRRSSRWTWICSRASPHRTGSFLRRRPGREPPRARCIPTSGRSWPAFGPADVRGPRVPSG